MLKEIHTITQLEQEKEKLQRKLEITHDAFVESLGNSRRQTQRFMLENVVIPAGVLGMGKFALKQFSKADGDFSSSTEPKNQKPKKKKRIFKVLFNFLFPVALDVLQSFILNIQKEKMPEQQPDKIIEKPANTQLKSVS